MRRRDIHQRRTYAARRASLAVDRLIRATELGEKLRASHWADAWAVLAGIRPSRRN